MQAIMLASYAARDLYVLTRIPTRDGFPVHVNLLASRFTQLLLTHVPLLRTYMSEFTLATTLSGTLFVHGSLTSDRHVYNHKTFNNAYCLE